MGYRSSLASAGATVFVFENFGSYQGDWYAKVLFKGELGWVSGSFGSCSGCDAFEGEFGWSDEDEFCAEHVHEYGPDRGKNRENCVDCQALVGTYQKRLAEFGLTYLTDIQTQEQVESYAEKNIEWDSDAVEMLQWLKDNSVYKHTLYTNDDDDIPDAILDRNGCIVLSQCMVCGKGEIELVDDTCGGVR